MGVLITTIRQQGNSAVTTVPAEIIRRLGIGIGSDLNWVEIGFGAFRVSPAGPDTAKAVKLHDDILQKYDSVFRALAK